MNKKIIVTCTITAVILAAGYFVPIDSYTTNRACNTPEMEYRQSLLFSGNLEAIRNRDKSFDLNNTDINNIADTGCFFTRTYKLYML